MTSQSNRIFVYFFAFALVNYSTRAENSLLLLSYEVNFCIDATQVKLIVKLFMTSKRFEIFSMKIHRCIRATNRIESKTSSSSPIHINFIWTFF